MIAPVSQDRLVSCACGTKFPDVRPNGLWEQLRAISSLVGSLDADRGAVAWEAADVPGERLQKLLGVVGDGVLVVASMDRLYPTPKSVTGARPTIHSVREGLVTPETTGDWWQEPEQVTTRWAPEGQAWACKFCLERGETVWLWTPQGGSSLSGQGSCCPRCQRRRNVCKVALPDPQYTEHLAKIGAMWRDGVPVPRIQTVLANEGFHDRWGRGYGRVRIEKMVAAWKLKHGSET